MSAAAPAPRTCWLVDLENTGRHWARILDHAMPGDLIAMFWSSKSCTPDLKDMSKSPWIQFVFIECSNGTPNALDFQLSAWLGMHAAWRLCDKYSIVSGDRGYTPLAGFMRRMGVQVELVDPNGLVSNPEPKPAAQENERVTHIFGAMGAANPGTRSSPEPDGLGNSPMENKPDAPDNTAEAGKKQLRKIYEDKCWEYGMSDPKDVLVMAAILLQSMAKPKNMRMLDTYNRLTAKYGAKDGTIRYNIAKAMIRDISDNGPWPAPYETEPEPAVPGNPSPGNEKKPSLTTQAVNTALGQANVPLSTGIAAKALQAIEQARRKRTDASRRTSLNTSVTRLFPASQHKNAFAALSKFL